MKIGRMNKYKLAARKFDEQLKVAQQTGEPVITAIQVKKQYEELTNYQIYFMESIKKTNAIISVSKITSFKN